MKTAKRLLWIVILGMAISFNACKKSTTGPGTNANYLAPNLVKDTIVKLPPQIATKESTLLSTGDTLGITLAVLVNDAEEVNGFSTILSAYFFIIPSDYPGSSTTKNSDGSTSFTWTYGGEGITLKYYNSSGESWWEYSADSSSYSKEWFYVDDKTSSGEIDMYNYQSFKSPANLVYKCTWSISGTATSYTAYFYSYDGSVYLKTTGTSNADKSGNMTVYDQNINTNALVEQYMFTWTKTGTGSYQAFNLDGMTNISQGSF